MVQHIIEFIVAYFTHLNARKIFGGVIALVGTALLTNMSKSNNANTAVLYACGGILIGGIGFIIIYYDIAKDKSGGNYDEMETLAKAYQQDEQEKISRNNSKKTS